MNTNSRFKDQALLLVTAIVVATACAVFFKYTGQYGSLIMISITVIGLMLDNVQLRKKVKELSSKLSHEKE